jgi:hypothetical protein
MKDGETVVDGFRFLPPKLSAWLKTFIPSEDFNGMIPFNPLSKPIKNAKLSVVTSAGVSLKTDPPFDMEREKRDSEWGDPSYRSIPRGTTEDDIDVNHLHINTSYIQKDLNVIFPLDLLEELAEEDFIGELAPTSYSFYGFQWRDNRFLETAIKPMTETMKSEEVDAVLLTPA